ncbi:outer membrane protein [Hansschlegelia plantiphila]|uniref:Outer membrane protein beta-barrel domain-containing protein n=1 Tax=Hansschlegelia plantiphila TaxID=374655 RepID=A0A9W6MVE8_9HYPH|nr:outer membrane beta-barrel protein [Hansschlegelia plantiphila]GLK67811.1 hypothetical protein GCM10008179_14490 [Hansschlegelia plantiphila]
MALSRLLIAGLVLALSSEAHAFEQSGATSSGPDPVAGPWVALRSFGFGGEAVEGEPKSLFDRIVLGVDGDVVGGGLDARLVGAGADVTPFSGIEARIGYAFDRFVAYGAAGVAFASDGFARTRERATAAGWSVGGGVETALFAGVAVKAEYLYVDLDRRSLDQSGDISLTPAGGQFRAGLNYRF